VPSLIEVVERANFGTVSRIAQVDRPESLRMLRYNSCEKGPYVYWFFRLSSG